MLLTSGSRLGRYTVISPLGRGGIGEVYLADDARLHRRVAIKVLNAQYAEDEHARARFVREAQMAAALDHPNICALHEIGTDEGLEYLVMPALQGETLAARLARGRPSLKEALDVAVELADALAYAHQRGVVHRDIKPQNVMLTPHVKLMDFGLAKAPGRLDDQQNTQTALTRDGMFLGTIPYMAPEQLNGAPADERSDIFSLGVTLYELFAGRHPFASASAAATITAITSKPAPDLASVAPDMPRALSAVLAKALAADPTDRHQAASDLHADLDAVRRGDDVVAAPRRIGAPRVIKTAAAFAAVTVLAWGIVAYIAAHRGAQTALQPPVAVPTPPASFSTWLEIQPGDRRPDTGWQESAAPNVLRQGSRFRVHVVPNGPGSLYIVGDERPLSGTGGDLTLLYPSSDASSAIDGALATDAYVVGGPAAEADVWIVWARSAVTEMEAVKPLANPIDRGVVRDGVRAASIRQWLQDARARSTSTVDTALKRVRVEAPADVVVHRFSWQQR